MAHRRIPPPFLIATAAVLIAAAGVVALVNAGGDGADADEEGGSLGGEREGAVEDLQLQPLGDARTGGPDPQAPDRLGDLLGEGDQPLVLNFFASWCQPCIEEMPAFETVHRDLAGEVTFVGLATSDGEDRALDIVEQTGVSYPTFADPDGAAYAFFGAVNMPTTVFISPEGDILEVHDRPLTEDELRQKIAEHFWS